MTDSMYDRLGDLLKETLESKILPHTEGTIQTEMKPVPPEVIAAFKLLGVDPLSSPEECLKAYRSKLKRYHPDNNSDNPIVQKVAAQKTRELIKTYKIIRQWFGS